MDMDEWKNAGGKLVDEEYSKEEARNQEKRAKRLREEWIRRRTEAGSQDPY
jgi:hypothetical protein